MREAIYRFGDVEVEPGGRELRRGGARVALEPKALDVLLVLLRDAGRVVDKRRLLAEVWADVHVSDSSLARSVTQVRRALGDDIKSPRYIETVPTRGYRFIGTLELVAPAVPPGPAVPEVGRVRGIETVRPSRQWARGRIAALVLTGAIAAAAIGVLAWRGAGSQAAPADLSAVLLSAVTHDAIQVTTSRGLDADPALSPDGGSIAYASDASGSLEIHVRPRVASGTARAVTDNHGDNVDPSWSPDGQWLVYHSRRFGGIWLVPAAGGPARQIVTDGSSPGWSPDGQHVVYQTAGEADVLGGTGGSPSTLAVVRVGTGEVEALTRRGDPPGSHGSPVWLPGHDTIVFLAVRVPGAEVWQVTRSGQATRLGACHATCRPFAFRRGTTTWVGAIRGAKAGELWLAPVRRDGTVDMSLARMTPLPRTLSVTDVSVSLDGTQMAFTNAERTSEAWTLDLPGGRVTDGPTSHVLLGERRPRYGEFAFSPDGTQLAYTTSRLGDQPEPWVHDLATGQSRPLGSAVAGYVRGWDPDGRTLTLIAPGGPPAIQRLDLVTGRVTPLIELDHWAQVPDVFRRLFTLRLSRDVGRYFYTSDDRGELGVWMASVEGTAPAVRVARDASFGAWSADGRRIAIQQHVRSWRTAVALVEPGTQVVRSLVTDADHAWPNDWSPDGRHIVYAALREGRWAIETVDVATGRVQRLTAPGAATEYVRWPVWSPRGDRIVYERGYWTGNVWVAPVR